LPDAELKRWVSATSLIDDEWVKDMNARGFDGKRLLEEARAACK
jgi:hypothetical protein